MEPVDIKVFLQVVSRHHCSEDGRCRGRWDVIGTRTGEKRYLSPCAECTLTAYLFLFPVGQTLDWAATRDP